MKAVIAVPLLQVFPDGFGGSPIDLELGTLVEDASFDSPGFSRFTLRFVGQRWTALASIYEVPPRHLPPWLELDPARIVTFAYVNWRGELGLRRVIPCGTIVWTSTEHHPVEQWIVRAWDLDKKAFRDFAMKDITGWTGAGAP